MIVIKEISLIAAKVVLVFCVTYMAKKQIKQHWHVIPQTKMAEQNIYPEQ